MEQVKRKKGWIAWAIVGGLVLVAILTCPKKADHVAALSEKLAVKTDISAESNKLDALFTVAVNKLSEYTLEASVVNDDYLIFSVGKLIHKDSKVMVSFGIFGHVFTIPLSKLQGLIQDNYLELINDGIKSLTESKEEN